MKRACAIVLVLLLTLSAVGCTGQNQQQDSVYKTNLMLDTIVQITLYAVSYTHLTLPTNSRV